MTCWKLASDKEKYGVVVYNFNVKIPHGLDLNIGDTVHIFEESSAWYRGCLARNHAKYGIFPKSFVHIKPAVIDKTGLQEIIIAREPPIIQEITSVLREWGTIWKDLYMSNGSVEFDSIHRMMNELITWRRQIMSGTLPVDEMKDLKQKVTAKIDMGNALLGLDLVVRDEQGNILNPDVTSTIHLYRQHEIATQRIQREKVQRDVKTKRSSSHFSHSLFVTVKNFVCRIGEDADVLMTLYDPRESRFISENYVVKWAKEGLARDLDQLNNLHVLFTDLGSKDLVREKVFLVCQIIRIGSMELKEPVEQKRSTVYSKKISDGIRRPVGVAVMDISDVMNGNLDCDEDKQHFIPFVQCGERDFLENVIRKMISSKDINQKDHKGQGLWICVKLLHGDLKQCKEENPHLFSSSSAIARKMGFPEIILPGDLRNDLYLTLVQGEFSRGSSKSSERNVQASVCVCNDKGQVIKNVISIGAGTDNMNSYNSVVYYHEDKPKWFETLKIGVPIEEFYNAHMKFTFRHRSSNEAKDKTEKPFAMSFIKLMLENGTILRDETHELLVYKIDHKKWDENSISYLTLPATKQELAGLHNVSQGNLNSFGTLKHGSFHHAGLSLSPKDSLHISTLVCSTKFTANVDLLGLLKWRINPDNLKLTLLSLMKVDGEEVVKFLQDTLDALFSILMQNSDSDLYDNLVFEALIFIVGLISDRKYQHFRPVLDMYITENFSATLADVKLMIVLKHYIDNATCKESTDLLLRVMKALEYMMKFIVRSRLLFAALNEGRGRQQFEISLKQLMQSISGMMLYTTDSTLLVQGACLKYLPCLLSDLLKVFDAKELSYLMTDFINNVPVDRLTKQKMMCVNDIIYSDLFKKPECRTILLPVINDHVKLLLERNDEEELCIKILGDIMIVLNSKDVGSTENDIKDIMLSILRTIIQCVIHMKRNTLLIGYIVAVLIDIMRQMTSYHYEQYISHFRTRTDMVDFLIEILMVFKDLVSNNVYPPDWSEMIMLQNCVMLKALRYFSHTIRDNFSSPFDIHVWDNFFYCAIAFLTQGALQLENFSQNKRSKIISRYKDMRREAGFEIRAMWFNLGHHKINFVPGMVGPFLEMTLIPETELRKATIPIFFDMMQREFYYEKHPNTSPHSSIVSISSLQSEPDHHHTRDIKGHFSDFENAMITQLDVLFEGGRGDEQYKDLFYEILSLMCGNHKTMHDQGMRFVKTVRRLMERLLEYRSIIADEHKENRMSCTVNLLEFYNEINRKEMYIRYLHKLCDLHLDYDNFTEAAYSLKLHAKLLRWTDESLPPILRSSKYPDCETHRELKERLYYDIIEYFNKGKMWEAGLAVCKELSTQYEHEVHDYTQLSHLLQRMAVFYDQIMKQMRPEPEYFRVAYYGRGFPVFLRNKVFVHRGKEYERLSDFSSHMQNLFPQAQLMTKLTPPAEDITESFQQYLQINKVDPIMEEKRKFVGKIVNEQVLKYYRVNEVQKFTYSRPIRKGNKDPENEFANMWIEKTNLVTSYPLPGILRWFPVTSTHTFEVSPLGNAIETMTNANAKIKKAVMQHMNDANLPINPLSMLLNGIVDAAVMGGVSNYEKAFFTPEYLENNPSRKELDDINKLKDLIAKQVPLLESGIKVHGQKAPESLRPFHEHMEQSFAKLRANIEEKYGKRTVDLSVKPIPPAIRRTRANTVQPVSSSSTDRLSEISTGSNESFPNSPNKISASSRAQSVWIKPNASSPAKVTKKRESAATLTLKRVSGLSASSSFESQTQWYDSKTDGKTDGTIIELNEQLTTHRPLRSEADKRHSRLSGQFQPPKVSTPPPITPTRHHSLASASPAPALSRPTTSVSMDSLLNNGVEEEPELPPPLPIKQCYADYSNLNDEIGDVPPRKNSLPVFPPRITSKPPPPLPVKEQNPPTPPKKPPHSRPVS